MIKLIASDMDGTLLNKQMQISSENISAIKEAQAKGIEFLVATGRAPSESQGILAKAGLHTGFFIIQFQTLNELFHHLGWCPSVNREYKAQFFPFFQGIFISILPCGSRHVDHFLAKAFCQFFCYMIRISGAGKIKNHINNLPDRY